MKYIIELKDDVQVVQKVGVTENGNAFVMNFYKDQLEELTADYINEHFGDLQDTAYQKGINDGSLDVKQRVEGAYQRGLDDAWEAARKVALNTNDGGLSFKKLDEIFDRYTLQQVFKEYTAKQTIEKLKAYEKKPKDKIEVGDEVKPFYTDITGAVTLIDGDTIYVLWRDGSSTSTLKLKEVTKTGRHFDIASILEEMKHD